MLSLHKHLLVSFRSDTLSLDGDLVLDQFGKMKDFDEMIFPGDVINTFI